MPSISIPESAPPLTRRSRLSIHLLVAAIVLLPIVVVSVALMMLATYTNRRVELELGTALVRTTAQRVSDNLASVFRIAERTSDLYAHRVQSGTLPVTPSDAWERLIYESMIIRPAVGSITYASADGQAAYVMRLGDDFVAGRSTGAGVNQTREVMLDAKGNPSQTTLRTYTYIVKERPWYKAAIGSDSPVWTDIYFWFSSQPASYNNPKIPGIGYVRQIRDEQGKMVGVISVDVKLEALSHILTEMEIARFGTVMIVDAQHRVVAGSLAQQQTDTPYQLVNLADQRDDNSVAALRALESEQPASRTVHLRDFGKHVYVEPLSAASGLNWCLVTILPDANVTGQIQPMQRNAILVGGAIVAAALVLGLFLSRFLSRPVAKLAEHLRSIGEGQFDKPIQLSHTVEFEQLSEAVNEMTRRLGHQVRLQVEKEAVERASTAKNAFFNRVTHELRTPLNAIIGYTEMLEEQDTLRKNPVVLEDLRRVMRASQQLLTLINELLDLARAESGGIQLRLSDVDPADIVRQVEEIALPLARRNDNKLKITLNSAPAKIHTDPQKLKQVLLNLVANSAKFTENGLIELSLKGDSNHLLFTVRDNGIGIPTDKIQRMFEPFAQADMTTEGTGLGLSICRQFVELLGGEILITSDKGVGTTAYVDIPIRALSFDPSPDMPSPSQQSPLITGGSL